MSQNEKRSSSPAGKPHAGPGSRGRGGMHAHMFAEKPKDAKSTLKRLIRYLGSDKKLLLALMVIVLLVTLLTLAGPALQAKAIDAITIVTTGETPRLHVDFSALFRALVLLVSVYIFTALLTYFQGIWAAKLSQNTVRTMRSDLFSKICRLPLRYIDTHPHGDIMSRMTNDVENIANTVSQSLTSMISGLLTIIGTLVVMLLYSPLMTLVSLITIPLTLLLSRGMARFMKKYFVKQQALLGELNGQVEEMVTGYKTVVAYGYEKKAIAKFNAMSDDFRKNSILAQFFGTVISPLMNLISNLGFLLIAVVGGSLAIKGAITVGVIQAFLVYSRQFSRPINELANLYAQILTAIAGAERVFAVMDEPSEPATGTLVPSTVKGKIEFRNVFFSYDPGKPVLKGLNLSVQPGQKVAIVGATGAGKTTIVNLLTRFYDIDDGEILIDGTPIKEFDRSALRKNIAIVLQDTVLFSDTIGYNIRYGRLDADMAHIENAAKASNAHIFIERLPQGYKTQLSESGANLSGGQRQLLSIARTVLADPRILILDEATSSVDTRTELHIQEAMMKLMENRTSLIIAHRLSTIRNADKIVVVDDGVVAEEGNHEELLARKGRYYRLYQTQYEGIAT
jgi:ATP-binding cassette subfamily B multidrug efflux pump